VEPISHRLAELSRRHLGEYAPVSPELSQVLALKIGPPTRYARTAILRVATSTGAFDQVFRLAGAVG
jgi:hypothetical protein